MNVYDQYNKTVITAREILPLMIIKIVINYLIHTILITAYFSRKKPLFLLRRDTSINQLLLSPI